MSSRAFRWTRNIGLAVIAILLGAFAIFGNPYPSHVLTLDTKEFATILPEDVDQIPVLDLADWIIQGRTDYRLIDIRSPKDFAEYHIPSAEQVTIDEMPEYPLLRNEKIVLYCNWGRESMKAWYLLKAQGYPGVYHLAGGLDDWKDQVLFPALPADASSAEIAEFETRRHVSTFFGGTPQGGDTAGARPQVMPTVEMATQPAVPTRKRPKAKEGC